MEARPIAVHMNPLHPHGDNKKIRTHKWKTSHTVMARTFYNYRKNEGGFIPRRSVNRYRIFLDLQAFPTKVSIPHR